MVEQPAGIPATFDEHAKLMFDLQVLAYQTDLTRVITFMMGRELSGRAYPEIGVPERTIRSRTIRTIPRSSRSSPRSTRYHVTLFAYYLEKLQATPDGDGSLLDHMMLMYGAGMSDSNAPRSDTTCRSSLRRRRRPAQGRPPRAAIRGERRSPTCT